VYTARMYMNEVDMSASTQIVISAKTSIMYTHLNFQFVYKDTNYF